MDRADSFLIDILSLSLGEDVPCLSSDNIKSSVVKLTATLLKVRKNREKLAALAN